MRNQFQKITRTILKRPERPKEIHDHVWALAAVYNWKVYFCSFVHLCMQAAMHSPFVQLVCNANLYLCVSCCTFLCCIYISVHCICMLCILACSLYTWLVHKAGHFYMYLTMRMLSVSHCILLYVSWCCYLFFQLAVLAWESSSQLSNI